MNLFPFKVYIPWFPNCKYVASDSCLFRKSCSDVCLACGTCSIWSWVNPCHLWGNNRKIHRNESKARLLPTCQQPFRFSGIYVRWFADVMNQCDSDIVLRCCCVTNEWLKLLLLNRSLPPGLERRREPGREGGVSKKGRNEGVFSAHAFPLPHSKHRLFLTLWK